LPEAADFYRDFEKKKNFIDLQRFILKEMRMQANYQPIMIRTLLESKDQRANKDVIAKKIEELNPPEPSSRFNTVPVYKVLENCGIVKREPNNIFILNSEELTLEERQQLIALCNWSIDSLELKLEELINAFDKNKNLFDPDRVSREEKERVRIRFKKCTWIDMFGERKIRSHYW
jgi:hypothetical protein